MRDRLKRGFTLIELLIVIAVIGVLIAIVVLAIDPLEQLARGRDAARKAAVAQLGGAMAAHVTNSLVTSYPSVGGASTMTATTWQTYLQNAGEIANPITVPALAGGGTCVVGIAGSRQNNLCYNPSGNRAVIYTLLESDSERDRSDGTLAGGTCTPTAGFGHVAWDSGQGRAGLVCTATNVALTSPVTFAP